MLTELEPDVLRQVRQDFLRIQPQLHLRLIHAAVGTWVTGTGGLGGRLLPFNRLLLGFKESGKDDNYFRDLATGKTHPFRAGRAYFIPSGHEVEMHMVGTWRFVSFQFTLDLFNGFDVMSRFPECRIWDAPELVAEARRLIRSDNVLSALCDIEKLIRGLCARWLSEIPVISAEEMRQWKQYWKVLDWFEKHGDAQTSVGDLAEVMGMGAHYFSQKFAHDLGLPPKAFIARTLLRKASLFLTGTNASVKEIARQLNFSSEFYFSRFFKKQMGSSPQNFRRMNNG